MRTDRFVHKYFTRTIFLLNTIAFFGINSPDCIAQEKILAKVGNKQITVKEFLLRSELTIRPNNFKDKETTLNNLIAEKILAIEAEKKSGLVRNIRMKSTVKGIKEQLMRNRLFTEVAERKVKLDTQEIKNAYRTSIREYELDFFQVRNKDVIQKIENILDSVPELSEEIFRQVGEIIGERPTHKAKYSDPDDDVLHKALFTNLLDTGKVIGPLRLATGDYILMKVRKWLDYPLMSGEDQRTRWTQVEKKLREIRSRELWGSYQAGVMKGKRLEFNREAFSILSELSLDYYLKNNLNDSLRNQLSEIPLPQQSIDLKAPFFTIDKKVWSVGEFKNELMHHPLVFRTTALNKQNFAEQFKLAIVDMVRDYYLTKEAYRKSLDKALEIKDQAAMWQDSFLAGSYLKSALDSVLKSRSIGANDGTGKVEYRESFIRSLQDKYGKSIWIDYAELNKISLTKTDFIAMQQGVPYPVVVPSFPALLNSRKLDYAQMKK